MNSRTQQLASSSIYEPASSRAYELKSYQPYFRLMWRVAPEETRELLEAIWAGHIVDWSRLDYNRHADPERPRRADWKHPFEEDIPVPCPAKGGNLSFANVTPPLLHAATMLAALDRSGDALLWTRRLARRWQQAENPKTGLSGGQLSYREVDRAQRAFGHVHPDVFVDHAPLRGIRIAFQVVGEYTIGECPHERARLLPVERSLFVRPGPGRFSG